MYCVKYGLLAYLSYHYWYVWIVYENFEMCWINHEINELVDFLDVFGFEFGSNVC